MTVIKSLVWDDWNIDHIARHNVNPEEVEWVCSTRNVFAKGKQGTYKVIGQTQSGRYLTVIVAPRGRGWFYPVTARDSDKKEKRNVKNKIRT
ncbi:hypothetical protein A2630_01885 [Candidatus Woesebacteria bacterium RIFCSPHIGHO2_01_FULL_44_10]|uniref:BrnT family toxin n=1 Tax=Candidatus Woesebacteria bacterium RIFCSPLOWO2_01_FULL_44_14 TaxID=1802525 RepID=A0A1F8C0T6_9BACT|nr:MAG: hypothetical protein A2630_01885 [Candidatus Woesebacteria bacterium RIFCSPHIGHO2_01_FULL_44_10]OGM53995.1 MAG: hypothetical protein A3F62_00300 [Candidatus Woesebacteria bacterium RIFCSPHIGHO2_12_FULL_44_11]OGM69963.1 MAG: hypothetical protein A2975_05140 [Candidatus Woesebacteria bacterium RIFCSPLOWO2_01_FULL_44_14]